MPYSATNEQQHPPHVTHPQRILANGLERAIRECKATWGVVLNTSQGKEAIRLRSGSVASGLEGVILHRPLFERSDAEAFLESQLEPGTWQVLVVPSEVPTVPVTIKPPPEFIVLSGRDASEDVTSQLCNQLGHEIALCRDHFANRTLRGFVRQAGHASTISDISQALCVALDARSMRAWIPVSTLDIGTVLELWWASNVSDIPSLHRVRSNDPSFAFEVYQRRSVLIAPDSEDPQIDGEMSIQVECLSEAAPRVESIKVSTFAGARDASLLGVPVQSGNKTIAVIVFSSDQPFAFRSQRIAYFIDHLNPILDTLFARLIDVRQNTLFDTLRTDLATLRDIASTRNVPNLPTIEKRIRDSPDDILRALLHSVGASTGALVDGSGALLVTCGELPAHLDWSEQVRESLSRRAIIAGSQMTGINFGRLYPLVLQRTNLPPGDPVVLVTIDEKPPLVPTTPTMLQRIEQLLDDHLQFVVANEHVYAGEKLRESFERAHGVARAFYSSALAFAEEVLVGHCTFWQCERDVPKPRVFLPEGDSVNTQITTAVMECVRDRKPVRRGHVIALPVNYGDQTRWILGCQREPSQRPFLQIDVACAELFCKQVLVFARAYQAIQQRDHVIATVPHELRVPITAINDATLGIEREKNLSPATRDRLSTIAKANDLSEMLITNLLCATGEQVTQGLEGKLELLRLRADVLDPVVNIVRLVGHSARLHTDSIDISQTQIDEFNGDRMALMCVFYNLLWNAVKYHKSMYSVLEIRVNAQKDETGGWTVRVHDHGMGVQPGWEEKIFDRGTRAPNARNKHGLGLGLHVSRKLVESWGGKLTLERPRGPTTFAVTLPKQLFPDREPPLHDRRRQ
jgi:signal transduction histidine kinase